jgi:hypothetical protein
VVTPPAPDDDGGEAKGSWKTAESRIPDLRLNVQGQTVQLLRADGATLSGSLHEEWVYSDAGLKADYDGEPLPHGSLRYQGFLNDDLVSVLGKKASTDGVIPSELYAGDRVAFADSKRSAAQGFVIGGICLSVLAPTILIAGVLGALLGRRRRLFK